MRKLILASRHPLRAIAMALAALAISWGVIGGEGLASAMICAVGGVALGEWLGRGEIKLSAILGGALVALLVGWGIASFSTSSELVPSIVGPGSALTVATVIRYGTLALVLVAAMRATAVRHPNAMAFELAAIAAAYTAAFAAHRDGVIARPLWLSDWAWQEGIDPAHVLLAIGGVAVVVLAILLIAERKEGLSVSSLIALAALALLAVLSLNVVGLPSPTAANDLGLNNPPQDGEHQQPPQNPDAGRGGNQGQGDAGQQPQGRGDGGNSGRGDGGGGSSGGDGGLDGGVPSGWRLDGGGGTGNSMLDGSTGQRDGGAGQGQQQQQRDGGTGQGQQQQQQQRQNPQFDENQTPSNSPAPMAVVILEDDYSPPAGAYYFRQDVWSEYNGSRLVMTTRDGVDQDVMSEFPTERTRLRYVPTGQGRTKVRARVALLVQHENPFSLEAPVFMRPTANPNPDRFIRAYRFEALAQTIDYRSLLGRTVGDPRWPDDIREYYLRGPEDPRYRELAEEIVGRLPPNRRDDPFAKALAIKLWLDRELIYSTRHRHAGVADPTADFLFGNRTGYCVHFAHSAVYLWRSVGIPARIGTGYHVPEENRQGGSAMMIRGGDAHAWPEIYFDKLGWIVLDIAAERNIDPPGNPVDDDLQRILGEMARDEEPEPEEPPPPGEKPYQHYGRDFGYAALSLLVAILLFLYGVKIWRRVVPMFAGAQALPRVAYRKALDLLAEAGFSRDFGETREAFAARMAEMGIAPSLPKLTEMHVAARLRVPAPGAPRPEFSPQVVRESLRAVSREIPKATKWWRRILGKIHPTSFLLSR